jgi:hypothetical protein
MSELVQHMPVPKQDETKELTISSTELHEMVQATMAVVLLQSRELSDRAKEYYKSQGIGAFLVMFPSIEALDNHPPLSATYLTLSDLSKLRYTYGCELVEAYDPAQSFVFIVGVQTVRHGTLFGGCVATEDLGDKLTTHFNLMGVLGDGERAEVLDKLAEEYERTKATRPPVVELRRCGRGGCASASTLMRTCARCQKVYYCSRSCQRTDWTDRHKLACCR